jgi:hypothetical protein
MDELGRSSVAASSAGDDTTCHGRASARVANPAMELRRGPFKTSASQTTFVLRTA